MALFTTRENVAILRPDRVFVVAARSCADARARFCRLASAASSPAAAPCASSAMPFSSSTGAAGWRPAGRRPGARGTTPRRCRAPAGRDDDQQIESAAFLCGCRRSRHGRVAYLRLVCSRAFMPPPRRSSRSRGSAAGSAPATVPLRARNAPARYRSQRATVGGASPENSPSANRRKPSTSSTTSPAGISRWFTTMMRVLRVIGVTPLPEELPQIDDRQQLAAHVREALDPRLRAGHARQRVRHAQHFARLFARHQVQLACHAHGDADPFAAGRAFLRHLRGKLRARGVRARRAARRAGRAGS